MLHEDDINVRNRVACSIMYLKWS